MPFYLTKKAKNDLRNIAVYTQENWGVKQRDYYLDKIDAVFHLVCKASFSGKKCDEIKSGYFKYNIYKHIILYRKVGLETEIVRILHEKMDISQHL